MPSGIGADDEGLVGVVGAVEQQAGTEIERPLVLRVQIGQRRDGGVQVEHLRTRPGRPRRVRRVRHLLEGQERAALIVGQHQPVRTARVRLSGRGELVAGAVAQAKQSAVELGYDAGVRTVEDRLAQLGGLRL